MQICKQSLNLTQLGRWGIIFSSFPFWLHKQFPITPVSKFQNVDPFFCPTCWYHQFLVLQKQISLFSIDFFQIRQKFL